MGCPAWHPSSRRHRRVAHGRGRCRTLWETDSRFISARARTRVHTRTRSFRPCLLAYLSDSDSRRCRSTIALSLSLLLFLFFQTLRTRSLAIFPNAYFIRLCVTGPPLAKRATLSTRERKEKRKKKNRNAEEISVVA